MEDWTKNVTYYPDIVHPLMKEKSELKLKYVMRLVEYANKFGEKNLIDINILNILYSLFGDINDIQEKYKECKKVNNLADNSSPFRIFSYRYVFLFDCLLLFAVDDMEKGMMICEELKKHVHGRYHKRIDSMVSKMYKGSDDFATNTLISKEMIKSWLNARQYVNTNNHDIVFTATMSAGKSTLINAIIGSDLSGAKKAACTSQVIRFHSIPIKSDFYTITDNNNCCYMQNINNIHQLVRQHDNGHEIICYFRSKLNSGRYTLIDTPGVNSSQNPQHKKITRNTLVNNVGTLVYVIPVESYGSTDDYEHLQYILKKANYERILFVINMIDNIDTEDDSVEEIMFNVREHLEQIGFSDPEIYPISAKAGLQLKQMLSGVPLTQNEKISAQNYIRVFSQPEYALAKYYSFCYKDEKELNYWPFIKKNKKIWNAYINTGLPGFENALLG